MENKAYCKIWSKKHLSCRLPRPVDGAGPEAVSRRSFQIEFALANKGRFHNVMVCMWNAQRTYKENVVARSLGDNATVILVLLRAKLLATVQYSGAQGPTCATEAIKTPHPRLMISLLSYSLAHPLSCAWWVDCSLLSDDTAHHLVFSFPL